MREMKSSKLTKDEKVKAFDFLLTFESKIYHEYGKYDWEYKPLVKFCSDNKIKRKGSRKDKYGNFFWFDTKQHEVNGIKINDMAHHFLRHIRNAVAHGNIRKESKMVIVDDYNTTPKQTMHGQLPIGLFWQFLQLVQDSRKN